MFGKALGRLHDALSLATLFAWIAVPVLLVAGVIDIRGLNAWHLLAGVALFFFLVAGPGGDFRSTWDEWRLQQRACHKRLHGQPLTLEESEAMVRYLRDHQEHP